MHLAGKRTMKRTRLENASVKKFYGREGISTVIEVPELAKDCTLSKSLSLTLVVTDFDHGAGSHGAGSKYLISFPKQNRF